MWQAKKISNIIYILVILVISYIYIFQFLEITYGKDIKGSAFCEFYNETMCAESQQGCSGKEECVLHDPDKRNHCYVLWQIDNVTKKSIIKLKVSLINNLSYSLYIL